MINLNGWLFNFFTLSSINIFLSIISFFTNIKIANSLGSSMFGEYSYFVAIGGYVFTLSSFGFEKTLVRDIVQNRSNLSSIIISSFIIRISILFFLLSVCTISYKIENTGLWLILVSVSIKAIDFGPVFDSIGKMKKHALLFLGERILFFIIIWYFLIFKKNNFNILVIGYALILSTVLNIFFQWCSLSGNFSFTDSLNAVNNLHHFLSRNVWIVLSLFLTLSFGSLSKIMIKNMVSSSELGIYSVSWNIVLIGNMLTSQIQRILLPEFTKIMTQKIYLKNKIKFIKKNIIINTIISCSIGLPVIIFANTIMRLFNEEYISSSSIMKVHAIYMIINALGQISIQYIVLIKKEIYLTINMFIFGVLSFFLLLYFIPIWKGFGAAIAITIAHGLTYFVFSLIMMNDLKNVSHMNQKLEMQNF